MRTDAQRLLDEILTHYGSIDDFLAQLERELGAPTMPLPRIDDPAASPWSDPTGWPIKPVPTNTPGRHARY
ncbi:hypothetical protein JK358_18495 [Nocardia sp. 2]|uniref:Uncharacterized protein n=1 Tax=Nocardia acididurans TaxID=2802282 RepID=A0ABS1M8B9_9NOCA|nr:hypothetical protein [Nocardia acididurans]MBL1076390.1 hypothetical protein [Nocardia acididurans]